MVTGASVRNEAGVGATKADSQDHAGQAQQDEQHAATRCCRVTPLDDVRRRAGGGAVSTSGGDGDEDVALDATSSVSAESIVACW